MHLLVTVAVLYLVTSGVYTLSCTPCGRRTCVAPTCRGGKVKDSCNCCDVCAKVEGESCAGLYGRAGKCDAGLTCDKNGRIDNYSVGTCRSMTGPITGEWVEDTRSGKAYIVLKTDRFEHDKGQQKCRENGGVLPEPRTAQENEFLHGLNTGMFYLGMTDHDMDGNWTWDSDGSPVTYTNWGPGQPNRLNNRLKCAIMVGTNAENAGDNWRNGFCDPHLGKLTEPLTLICERAKDF